MKYYCLCLTVLLFFVSCKKDIEQSPKNKIALSSNASLSSNTSRTLITPLYRQNDTTNYSTGNITPYQFQTQEIDLIAGENNTYTANFGGVTLQFSSISHPLYWATGQSAGLFTIGQIGTNLGYLSSTAPNFSLSGYVETSTGFQEQTYTIPDKDKNTTTWHIYSTGTTSYVFVTMTGVLIMSHYSPSTFAIMPGAYHPRDILQ